MLGGVRLSRDNGSRSAAMLGGVRLSRDNGSRSAAMLGGVSRRRKRMAEGSGKLDEVMGSHSPYIKFFYHCHIFLSHTNFPHDFSMTTSQITKFEIWRSCCEDGVVARGGFRFSWNFITGITLSGSWFEEKVVLFFSALMFAHEDVRAQGGGDCHAAPRDIILFPSNEVPLDISSPSTTQFA
ncbi:hypothetical protein TREMEDRAFT_61937 [Tremella mesenterica DSM 1558]|uniref:uncharacterized protein n=1 Tax=Tremella mesenterica (strain ATCC 24925 / CBS 8224 / DSM 1558 / NBRC 9311 / NRRL Y-6157 / RJB 2259-6 / UBC 559-6) TaxID=578456 RepID=UPI0003F4A5C7|nr:uncharacterized protein TREMEDRAFT_61937 [Tremella mesenterica DSM 1558]EIW70174.1 hypothetical protein TREMEDRAFT_61937 [Tremella mesenterica DSM 1558]